jgi:hypothetical protein
MTTTLLTDLTDFVDSHRPHGLLTADATEPAWNGYRLPVACCVVSHLSAGSLRWMRSWICCGWQD